jgi:hypothetical protein
MNAPNRSSRDQMLDQNLRRIAANVSLPTAPTSERIAAWKATGAEAWSDFHLPRRRPRLLRLWPLVTSAAAAAGIALAAFVILANPRPVSAETIFNSFRAVLGGPFSIDLDDIGFEDVSVSGQIVKDVDSAGMDHRYSEIHAVLKSSNPEWADLESVDVLNEAPDQGWMFSSGSGGATPQERGPDGRYHVKVVELFYGGKLPEFIRAKALYLEDVPWGLGFNCKGSGVAYTFKGPERRYLCSLVELTEHIADAQSPDDLIDRVKNAAGSVRVEPAEGGWRLRAGAFQPSVLFPELDLSLPDADLASILGQVTYEVEFVGGLSPDGVGSISEYFKTTGDEELQKLHISLDWPALKGLAGEAKTAAEYAARVRPLAREVTIVPGSHGGTAVRVRGCEWKLNTSERDRLRQLGTEILPRVELLIDYDARTNSMRWAEFRNLTPGGGTIRLEPGAAHLDPALLDPKHWITENTIVFE